MTSNIRPMGLTHEAAQAIHAATDELLDAFLARALETLEGGEALERELVDAARRWAARHEEGMVVGEAEETLDVVVGMEEVVRILPVDPHPMPDEAAACYCSTCMKAIGAVETCSVCGSTDSGGRWHHDVKRTVCDGCFNRWPGAGAG